MFLLSLNKFPVKVTSLIMVPSAANYEWVTATAKQPPTTKLIQSALLKSQSKAYKINVICTFLLAKAVA